jgi:hypothetical protein
MAGGMSSVLAREILCDRINGAWSLVRAGGVRPGAAASVQSWGLCYKPAALDIPPGAA